MRLRLKPGKSSSFMKEIPCPAARAIRIVRRRERRGQLRAGADLGAPHGDEGAAPTGVRAVIEAETLRQAQRVQVRLPAGRAVRARGLPEDLLEALAR